jgi:hypothetical protein
MVLSRYRILEFMHNKGSMAGCLAEVNLAVVLAWI